MAITDDLRKTLTDPKPLYFLVGTADLAAEKLGEMPALVEKLRAEAPRRFEAVRNTDVKEVQDQVTRQAKQAQEKLTDLLSSLDTDLRNISQQAQELALQGVGRVAEYTVKAQETYGDLAERGKGAVRSWRGDVADEVEELAVAIEPEPEPRVKEEPKAGTGEPTVAAVLAEEANAETTTEGNGAGGAKKTPARKTAAKKNTPSVEK
ncbi:hypothetical protein [Streptomyces sp. MST-110588]|uniref:hypothetical protein n=1 Tax=Streptomyces sp. MST-110588 TaxID=2833628 RepID=UPI001F5CD52C|nr:hypothetical protein [Streptomyces sp. MST-110588]UNO40542.1 hypothetical protein KGS77_14345 [Streptomyces sp. MST-110588]